MPNYTPPNAPTFQETTNETKTFVHIRGDFLRKGEEAQPGALSVLHPFKPRSARPDRLDLARWLVDPANPLTSRGGGESPLATSVRSRAGQYSRRFRRPRRSALAPAIARLAGRDLPVVRRPSMLPAPLSGWLRLEPQGLDPTDRTSATYRQASRGRRN